MNFQGDGSDGNWLSDRLPGDRHSISSLPGDRRRSLDVRLLDNLSLGGNPLDRTLLGGGLGQYECWTEIETEFPATPTSPRSKHVSVVQHGVTARAGSVPGRRSCSTSSLPTRLPPQRHRTHSASNVETRAIRHSDSHHSGRQTVLCNTSNNSQTYNGTGGDCEESKCVLDKVTVTPGGRGSYSGPSQSSQVSQPVVSTPQSSRSSHGHSSVSIHSSSSSSSSRIPMPPVAQNKHDLQIRRNSLKAEYSIRQGSHSQSISPSPVPTKPSSPKSNVSSIPSAKSLSTKPSGLASKSSTRKATEHSRSPSNSSRKSSTGSVGSKLPMGGSKTTKLKAKDNSSPQNKSPNEAKSRLPSSSSSKNVPKSTADSSKLSTTAVSSKLVPPKSPMLRHSGIKTTLCRENSSSMTSAVVRKSDSSVSIVSSVSSRSSSRNSSMSSSAELKTVYAINTVSSVHPSCRVQSESSSSKPMLPVRGNKPARPETHYPIMGLTTLSHTSPKTEDVSPKIYANITSATSKTTGYNFTNEKYTTKGSSSVSSSFSGISVKQSVTSVAGSTRPGYFYDYSDEDSDQPDGSQTEMQLSRVGSLASSVSLEELLDRTLETMGTPSSEFSSGSCMFSSTQTVGEGDRTSRESTPRNSSSRDGVTRDSTLKSGSSAPDGGLNLDGRTPTDGGSDLSHQSSKPLRVPQDKSNNGSHAENIVVTQLVLNERLSGKPDIVKDTESSEQRHLQKTMPLRDVPGSSIPGYRAKRPKSLILGAKEKFVYCEYGSSSSPDSSDADNGDCKFSYAKDSKEQEIKSKVARCVKTGNATVIETSRASKNHKSTASEKDSDKVKSTKPSGLKKPSKIPPPIATKPTLRKSSIPKLELDTQSQRPKSVEICVNTVLSVSCSKKMFKDSDSVDLKTTDLSKSGSEKTLTYNSKLIEVGGSSAQFEEGKVERSGSKDDGYSTMSSDVQPENLEKYADAFDSSASTDVRTSNLSLSSQTSYSSEDRQSSQGSMGRVRAMKLKFEHDKKSSDSDVSPVKSPTKTPPPVSPRKSRLQSPPPVSSRKPGVPSPPLPGRVKGLQPVQGEMSQIQPDQGSRLPPAVPSKVSKLQCGIPVPNQSSSNCPNTADATNMKCAIPLPKPKPSVSTVTKINTEPHPHKVEIRIPVKGTNKPQISEKLEDAMPGQRKCFPITNPNYSTPNSASTRSAQSINDGDIVTLRLSPIIPSIPPPHIINNPDWAPNAFSHIDSPYQVINKHDAYLEQASNMFTGRDAGSGELRAQFEQLAEFERVEFAKEGSYDSNSSLSDRGSDLTSLHISEDNMLSDIPEERDGYESSARTESVSSLPGVVRRSNQPSGHHGNQNVSSAAHHHAAQFNHGLVRHWGSCQGLVRAAFLADYEHQRAARQNADYEELYGGCLNLETLLERASSESDMYTRGDRPAVTLLPALTRGSEVMMVDEMGVEEQLQAVLKSAVMTQV